SVAEAAVNQWGAVGIQVNMRIVDSATGNEINNAGTWDTRVVRGGQAFALPFVNVTALAPITQNFGMHREGTEPRVLMDFEPRLIEIMNEYRRTFDAEGRK